MIGKPVHSTWRVAETVHPQAENGYLTGTALIAVELTGIGDELTLHIRGHACRRDICLALADLVTHAVRFRPRPEGWLRLVSVG